MGFLRDHLTTRNRSTCEPGWGLPRYVASPYEESMAATDIDVRSATALDRETIIDLLIAQLSEHAIDTPRAAVCRAIDGMLANDSRGFVLIARRGPRVAGVAYVAFTWTLEHGGKSAWLEEFYVVPAQRNQGIGAALLSVALQRARAAGCAAVDLEVDRAHARAAHLYTRAGFTPLTRERWVRSLSSHDPQES